MNLLRIRNIISLLSWIILLSCSTQANNSSQADYTTGEQDQETSPIRSYTVNKKVSDFPLSRDLSTPEAAYATIMRDFMATGASPSEWSEISVKQMQGTQRQQVSPERTSNCLDAQIQEVIIYRDRLAIVVAKMRGRDTVGYDQRFLFYSNGRWLNSGHDGLTSTIEKARDNFLRKSERIYKGDLHQQKRQEFLKKQPVADPNSYIKPYVDFLQKQGHQPHSFMMEAFSKYQLVVMGEIHNRPTYWAFNAELVRDPAFARTVGTIYMELPSNHQESIDRFLIQNTCEKEPVIQMLRDFFELGWPCKPTLDFFVAAWQVNQKLPSDMKPLHGVPHTDDKESVSFIVFGSDIVQDVLCHELIAIDVVCLPVFLLLNFFPGTLHVNKANTKLHVRWELLIDLPDGHKELERWFAWPS